MTENKIKYCFIQSHSLHKAGEMTYQRPLATPLSFESNKKIDANKGKLSYRKVLNCIYYKFMAFIRQF